MSGRREEISRPVGDRLHFLEFGLDTVSEHSHLEGWPVGAMRRHLILRHGLDDEVDVTGDSGCMRPQAVVDLLRSNKLTGHVGREAEQCAELGSLSVSEVRNSGHMSDRLHDQGPKTKRSDAVFHPPVLRVVNETARQEQTPSRKVTCFAVRHA